jgi:hypothetical protein
MAQSKRASRKKNGFRKFWRLGMEEFNTAQFDISSDDTLTVREGNYQYNIFNIIKRYGTSTEIFFSDHRRKPRARPHRNL